MYSWIIWAIIWNLLSQNNLEYCKHKNENDKDQQEGLKLFQDSKKHLNEVAVFFFESYVLKKSHCGPNDYEYLDQIVSQLHPSKILKFSIYDSQNQMPCK